jgi:hypothetical protein
MAFCSDRLERSLGTNPRSFNGTLGVSPNARGACAFSVPEKSLHRKAEHANILQLALPNYQNFPALLRQSIKVPGIACLVLPELRKPEVSIRIRYQSRFAGVRMPETAVYEYHFAPCGKYKVRLARKVSPMQTKTIAQSMYEATNLQFGLRVLTPDCSHVLAAVHRSSLLEFLKEPIQDRTLLVLSCSSNLR